MLILGRPDVARALAGSEGETLRTVADAYVAHASGDTVVPHSLFLRFPNDDRNRIIALPSYVGGARPLAGVKWISSFPDNTVRGFERASAAIVLNSLETGHPEALLEGSLISAWRTAASAAVAAQELTGTGLAEGVSLVGCGVINFEILRFLRVSMAGLRRATLFDSDAARAGAFAERVAAELPGLEVDVADAHDGALEAHTLVSFATTASRPYADTAACAPGTVVLHVSLRDLTPDAILGAVNVVDDVDHVCREGTSLDLAARAVGHRRFVHAELGRILAAQQPFERDPVRVTVFSPFGLGALDVALADLVRRRAEELELGTRVEDFLAVAPIAAAT